MKKVCTMATAARAVTAVRAAGAVRPAAVFAAAAALAAAVLMAASVTACSTTVKQEVERPANLEVETYNAVSALPFKTSSEMGRKSYDDEPVETFEDYYQKLGQKAASENDEYVLLAQLDDRLAQKLFASSQLNYVDPADVEYAIRHRSATIPADMYITGGLTTFSSTIEKEESDTGKTDKDDKPIMETKYWREASATLLYQVVETRTNRVISKHEYSFSDKSSKVTDWKKVSSTYAVLSPYLNSLVNNIMEDFTPHTETMELTLLKGKSKEMKEAEKLAGKGQLAPARNRFLSIYRSQQLFEAGYNAALLYEAMEMYDEALRLMTDVWQTSGDSRAKEKMRELQKEKDAAARLQKQRSQR